MKQWLGFLVVLLACKPDVPVTPLATATDVQTTTDTQTATDVQTQADAQQNTDVQVGTDVDVDVYTAGTCPCDGVNPCACLDDGDPCTADTCVPGKCKHEPICAALLPPGLGNSPCKLEGDLPQAQGVQLVPVFTKMPIEQPILLGPWGDGTNRLFIAQRPGAVVLIDNDPASAKKPLLVLNVTAKVNYNGEGGLLGTAMHPKFKQNRKMYVSLTTGTPMHSQILEYVVGADDIADKSTERLVMDVEQPSFTNHKGGMIAFDASGMLLYGLGDGGSANDPFGNGQNTKVLLGKMLRIDPDHPANGKGYGIPKDNPFVGNTAFLPEIFAYGLRNPWRWSVDRLTGEIWVADVGQDTWEEVDLLQGGKNYGWNTMEATHCFPPGVTTCKQTGLTLPVVEYKHDVGKSITGGYVYRGSQQKSLYGKYLFADYNAGTIFTIGDGPTGKVPLVLGQASFNPVSFGEDRDGELYVTQLFGALGTVFHVTESAPKPASKPLPLQLSATKCFTDLKTLTPAAGMIPYEVNAPLWSDGAAKKRFLVLPPGVTTIPPPPDDYTSWDLPQGTLIVKHFALGDTNVPVETRFMRRDADGWKFFTYKWKKDGSDAELQPGGGGEQDFQTVQAGKPVTATWHYPTQMDCLTCHHSAGTFASQVLGVQTAQLDRPAVWNGTTIPNQLTVLRQAGIIAQSVKAANPLPTLTDLQQPQTDPAIAARAWLHANCSECHRPGGAAPSDMDLRFQTPLSANHACGKPAQNGAVVGATQILVPGHPEQSTLWLRLQEKPGNGVFMPHIAVHVQQPGAVELLKKWISALTSCLP